MAWSIGYPRSDRWARIRDDLKGESNGNPGAGSPGSRPHARRGPGGPPPTSNRWNGRDDHRSAGAGRGDGDPLSVHGLERLQGELGDLQLPTHALAASVDVGQPGRAGPDSSLRPV